MTSADRQIVHYGNYDPFMVGYSTKRTVAQWASNHRYTSGVFHSAQSCRTKKTTY
ncbi:hypothetical protein OK016_23370 [Vibrio chagasii]|nr:hypothetical protein [Vibrio chagasii]